MGRATYCAVQPEHLPCARFDSDARREMVEMGSPAPDAAQHLAMLRILYGACATALDAFRAANNAVDARLVLDLEAMVERTRGEIDRLSAHLAQPS
jgi:hypothetical protein